MRRPTTPILLLAFLLAACNEATNTDNMPHRAVDISSSKACSAYLAGKAFSNGKLTVEFPDADQVVVKEVGTGKQIARCRATHGVWAELNEQIGGTSRLIELAGCFGAGFRKLLLRDEGDLFDNETNVAYPHSGKATPAAPMGSADEYALDPASAIACENYLKGKTFTGGSARLKFGYDGTVSAYDSGGQLVFGGTLEVGQAKSEVSRWIYIRDMSGGGKLQFLLSADGKMMEPNSLVIYKPE